MPLNVGDLFIGDDGRGLATPDFYLARVCVWDVALGAVDRAAFSARLPPKVIRESNLRAYYELNKESALQTNEGRDLAGDLTVSGATYNSDHPSLSGSLDCSAHQYACARLLQTLVTEAPFSKVAWVKINSYPAAGSRQFGVIATDNPTNNVYYHRLRVYDDATLYGIAGASTRFSTIYAAKHLKQSIKLGSWAHIGATWEIESTNTRMRAFQHGFENTSGSNVYPSAAPTGIAQTLIGNEAFYLLESGRNLNGRLAHAAIYNTVLTAEDFVLLQSLPPSSVKPENLVAYWPGSVVNISGSNYLQDASGNGYHALLENQAAWNADEPQLPVPARPAGLLKFLHLLAR
jgi:hypothetical protein